MIGKQNGQLQMIILDIEHSVYDAAVQRTL